MHDLFVIWPKAIKNTFRKVKMPNLHNLFDLFQCYWNLVDGHVFLRLHIEPQVVDSFEIPGLDHEISLLVWQVKG